LFTDEETRHLFRQVFDLELTPGQLAEYREHTHGWITALQLVRQVAQKTLASYRSGHGGPADLVEVLRQSERDIFDYFAEEVFSDESEEVRQLLLKVALLDRIELDTCGALLEGMNCSRILPSLVRRNVFITVASDGKGEEYRLHPLFQSFLRRRLRSDIGRSGLAREHQRYADHFLKRGSWEQGTRHLLAAEDFVAAAEVVRLLPGEAGIYRAEANPTSDAGFALLETKLLARHLGPVPPSPGAPQVQVASGEQGGGSDLETRIDQAPAERLIASQSVSALKELLDKTPLLASLQVQSTAPDEAGVFVRIHSAVVLVAGSEWNQAVLQSALTDFVRPGLTASQLGVGVRTDGKRNGFGVEFSFARRFNCAQAAGEDSEAGRTEDHRG